MKQTVKETKIIAVNQVVLDINLQKMSLVRLKAGAGLTAVSITLREQDADGAWTLVRNQAGVAQTITLAASQSCTIDPLVTLGIDVLRLSFAAQLVAPANLEYTLREAP